ncbi:MAG: hypothetical protein ACRC1H_14730, partial [Caldilineaceae bacterium]
MARRPMRQLVAPVLLVMTLLPAAALAAPHAGSRPTNPPPTRLEAATLDLGAPLADWLAVVPDTDFYRNYLVFGDMEAWFDETGIERPTSADELRGLSESDFDLVSFVLTSQTEPPPALGLDYILVEDQTQRLGFSFFNTNQFLWSSGEGNDLSLLRVENSEMGMTERLLEAGYSAQSFPGGVLYSLRDDNEIDLDAESPMDRLAFHNRVAVIPRGDDEVDLLVARATTVITPALAAAAGEGDSLADDMGYRTLANAVDYADLVPGSLVGLTILGGEQQPVPLPTADAAEIEAYRTLLADYAEEPLPPYRMAAFGTSRDGEDTYLTLYLVLAPGEDA